MNSNYKDDPLFFQALFDPLKAMQLVDKYDAEIPELEPIISTNPYFAVDYAINYKRSRFPEAEPIIFKHPFLTAIYAPHLFEKRIPCIELMISQNLNSINKYLEESLYIELQRRFQYISPVSIKDILIKSPSPLELIGVYPSILKRTSLYDRYKLINMAFIKIFPLYSMAMFELINNKTYSSLYSDFPNKIKEFSDEPRLYDDFVRSITKYSKYPPSEQERMKAMEESL